MIMKKLSLFTSSFLLVGILASAQPGPGGPGGPGGPNDRPSPEKRKERIEAMKVGFITDRLQLTPSEAQAFWPVYNQYQDDLEKLRKSRKENLVNAGSVDDMSDAEVEKMVDQEMAFRQSELDLQKKYHPQFKKVLPIKKVAKMYKAEDDFRRELLNQLQSQRDGDKKGGRKGGQGGKRPMPN